MTIFGKLGFRVIFIVLTLLAAHTADAQWQPQWSTPWQHPEPFVVASPILVSVASDGSTYTVSEATHHSLGHLALMRVNADGTFAWLQEHQASTLAGIAFMGTNKVAIAGDVGSGSKPVEVRVYDTETGALIWSRQAGDGGLLTNYSRYTSQLAVDTDGNLMVLASDHHDYVVIRFDIDGNPLPVWRYEADPHSDVQATAIVALPDGGAVITGLAAVGTVGANVTVRLDANGNPIFTDIQLPVPALGLFTFGVAHLGVDNDGNAIVAAARESGRTIAQVWKVSSTGTRLWTTYLPGPGPTVGSAIDGFALSAGGDPLIGLGKANGENELVRLDGATGDVLSDIKPPIGGRVQDITVATNGRILLGGYISSFGNPNYGVMAEFTENGKPCRVTDDIGISGSIRAGADANGWRVLGATVFVEGVGNKASVSQFDSDGECTFVDSVFADGFESEMP